jgi:hypothetical protein
VYRHIPVRHEFVPTFPLDPIGPVLKTEKNPKSFIASEDQTEYPGKQGSPSDRQVALRLALLRVSQERQGGGL